MALNGAWKQCPNGHWYDSSATSTCPQCAASATNRPIQEYGATMPIGGTTSGGLAETQPANGDAFQGFPPTEPVGANVSNPAQGMPTMINFDDPPAVGSSLGATVPAIHDYDKDTSNQGTQIDGTRVTTYDDPHGTKIPLQPFEPTSVVFPYPHADEEPFSPVVGWLVCIEGADRGRDYRIHAGYNSIGRSEHMDIYIAGDSTISRDRHARIAYDPEERVFFFGPAEGRNLVRLNGKLIMQPTELHAYDIIGFNKTKLMFVPFCGERFNWDE